MPLEENVNKKTLDLLEFPRIRAQLTDLCGFSASKELAGSIEPTSDRVLVERRLALTTEAVRVLDQRPNLTVGATQDIRSAAERARLGGTLDAQELLAIRATIGSARALRTAIVTLDEVAPELADLAGQIVDHPFLEDEIGRCLSESGDVLDSASPELGRIRAEIRVAHQRLLDRLHDLVYGGSYRNVLQEPVITMRGGRYVVPVRSDSRGQLRGLIHDQSSSGHTVYVEPFVTVELNNRWRQLQAEETHEIERIMQSLSELVAASADALAANVENIAALDLNLAKARLAAQQNAVNPFIDSRLPSDEQRGLRLINARHPLLRGHVVPITLRLGDDFRVMVITGPNTGGKTVALKTAGLLTLMAQAGLHIPADSGSQIHLFDEVLADIGDEQSIEQSLSTFSSHMRNVVEIVRQADVATLVLLDEVGAGTDPAEGAALARAVLRRLLTAGSWVIATTHYTELKAFAHDTVGMTNASVEFDPVTLAPTYRLQIGLPGKSNALAIAGRLGLDPDILKDAESMLDTGQIQVENLLEGIHAERRRTEEEAAALESERRETGRVRAELQRRLETIEEERREVLRRARREAEEELADLRAQLRRAATALQRTQPTRDEVISAAQALESINRRRNVRQPASSAIRLDLPDIPRPNVAGVVSVGDQVRVRPLDREGQVMALSDDGGSAEVHVGNFKMKVPLDELERVGRVPVAAAAPPAANRSVWNISQRVAPSSQFDIRGWRADQVAPELEQYLNDAYMTGLTSVRIIHGKGTGVLRQVVRDYLRASALIKQFETADPREGGDGATIAYLAL